MSPTLAATIASLSAAQLTEIAKKTGYNDTNIHSIKKIDIREKDVCFDVQFVDDGSFDDLPPLGKVFVSRNKGGTLTLEF